MAMADAGQSDALWEGLDPLWADFKDPGGPRAKRRSLRGRRSGDVRSPGACGKDGCSEPREEGSSPENRALCRLKPRCVW